MSAVGLSGWAGLIRMSLLMYSGFVRMGWAVIISCFPSRSFLYLFHLTTKANFSNGMNRSDCVIRSIDHTVYSVSFFRVLIHSPDINERIRG
jgi:hypothetical protein